MGKRPTSRRRNRRLAIATAILAAVSFVLFAAVWMKWEQIRVDRWIAAANELELEANVAVDQLAVSPAGKLRGWLKMPVVHVVLWAEPEAKRLLKAPRPVPAHLIVEDRYGVSPGTHRRIAERFPAAEFRTVGGGMGGMGFF